MILLGTVVNGLAIMIGALIGLRIKGFSESMKETVMKAISLAVIMLGLSMGLESEQFLFVIISLAVGGVIGERLNLEGKLNHTGKWLEQRLNNERTQNQGEENEDGPSLAQGFVIATLVFVVGAMSVIGALDSGVRHDHSILYTKSLIDGFSSIVFATTLGFGVFFAAFPVLLYQGSIAIFASFIVEWLPTDILDQFIIEMTAVGGVMIMAIGFNLLGITNIRVANLLPGLIVVILLVVGQVYFF
ncbi:DUF554 domain-containing protein [Texcoconibacillus texcoconensis]|uniref:DUF554 domain-containing protein n=1 Tax=Texcoconibacillus texcoconensis TaxID=1095777 RepID=A0A840QU11_9BACI|nr:DUF554 domain-containing protein [Texcoconibacillus texcoconensis]MBB5174771.1 hypothetical protein [Texcoconibacillus texcoconensis]